MNENGEAIKLGALPPTKPYVLRINKKNPLIVTLADSSSNHSTSGPSPN